MLYNFNIAIIYIYIIYIYIDTPGSSRYVTFLPKLVGFLAEFRQTVYTQKEDPGTHAHILIHTFQWQSNRHDFFHHTQAWDNFTQ